jgi:hypothetical protein
MDRVGFEPTTSAAGFLETRFYLRLEEIAKKGTNDCSNPSPSTLLTNFLVLRYISAIRVPLRIKYQPLVTANNPIVLGITFTYLIQS